jgi:hypothetical protein
MLRATLCGFTLRVSIRWIPLELVGKRSCRIVEGQQSRLRAVSPAEHLLPGRGLSDEHVTCSAVAPHSKGMGTLPAPVSLHRASSCDTAFHGMSCYRRYAR